MHHYGDPCIHCAIPHDAVPVGPCQGDRAKAKILAYCVDRQAWENPGSRCDTVLVFLSTGEVSQETWHPAEGWAYNERFRDAETLARHEFRRRYRVTFP